MLQCSIFACFLFYALRKGVLMSTAHFVHVEQPSRHPGVERAEAVIRAARRMQGGFDSARGLAAMLLAAIVSALLVVADTLLEAWAGNHLLLAWVGLWAVGFAAIALLAGTVRRFSAGVVHELDAWSARKAQARADERLWSIALKDARVMSDLQSALARDDAALVLPTVVASRARAYRADAQQRSPLPSI
jgi:hypothetical protein